MITPKELVRNHLLAATMNGRWETLTEIKRALCRETNSKFQRSDVWNWVLELSRDGVHSLEFRHREGKTYDYKEYRLRVKPEKIMETRRYVRPALPLPEKV